MMHCNTFSFDVEIVCFSLTLTLQINGYRYQLMWMLLIGRYLATAVHRQMLLARQ